MVADWHDGFLLGSTYLPGDGNGTLRLSLTNRTKAPVEGFRVGFSGQIRAMDDARISNGRIVTRLSGYHEIAPPAGFILAAGATWETDIDGLAFPLRHWTDGPAAGFVVFGDGRAVPAVTTPPARENSAPYVRGTMPLGAPPAAPISVVPWPDRVAVTGRRSPPQGLTIAASGFGPALAAKIAFTELVGLLFPGEGLVRDQREDGLGVMLSEDAALGPEAYRIGFYSHGAKLEAATATGFLYGLITLGQMARGARLERSSYSFPTGGSIEDAPANLFHWHLSDDEAWRVEIDAYPRLTEIGAWRGLGLPLPPLLGSGPEKSGGFYSKADVKALVARAGRFGIEVIPEIDMPGHCYAMLLALPELQDPGENGLYGSIQHFPNNCLNPAVEAVYPALETILGEMVELFPGPRFHLGADEVPAAAWETSPLANQMRDRLGATGAPPLQASLLKRMQAFLTSKGKITGAWEEAAHGGGIDKANCYLVGWVNVEGSQKLAAEGYEVVVAPGQAYYLDMANGPEWHEPGAGWAGWSSPEKAYRFDPTAGWSEAEKAKFLGVQACIWSEPFTDRAVFDRLVFPRLSAIAETGWTKSESKSFARFAGLVDLMPNLYGRREGA